ncbi:MAG: hypothetical protein V1692_00780 [bacterium]
MEPKETLIGFIGQGWIGKNYANDFEQRGYRVIRYCLEMPENKEKIKDCDLVFIAVPTPTTPAGFDDSILRQVIKLVGDNKTAIIKSTILPGTTESIQKENPNIYVLHSPEFLTEANAAYEAAHPNRNIIGLPIMNEEYQKRAAAVMAVLPQAPYQLICQAQEAELIKYAGNCYLYFKVIFANIFYEVSEKLGCDWEIIKKSLVADPRIGNSHLQPIFQGGRGAGGHCFIKDFAAFLQLQSQITEDKCGTDVLKAIEKKNIDLLTKSHNYLDLLADVYGEDIIKE